jgi:pyridoxamine 5'-phosphate oxidase-like protein
MRNTATRKADVLQVLEKQGRFWLATSDIGGRPHMIGVSGWWDGTELVFTTAGASRTARNMTMNPLVTLASGDPSDAIVIQAQVLEGIAVEDAAELARGFSAAMGWDPREMDGWMFFRLRPTRIQAFRGYEEIEGRDVMVKSRWLA